MYHLFTADIPETKGTMVATFVDYTAMLDPHEDYHTAVKCLQRALKAVVKWTRQWKIHLNAGKTIRIDFTLRSALYELIFIDDTVVRKK